MIITNDRELRIGNWLKTLGGDYTRIKSGAMIDNAALRSTSIALNTEILVNNCGFYANAKYFDKDFKGGCFRIDLLNGMCTLFIGTIDQLSIDMDYDCVTLPIEVKELHHLQNVFYFNTGKELEVKL